MDHLRPRSRLSGVRLTIAGLSGAYRVQILCYAIMLIAFAACTTVAPIDYIWSGDKKAKLGDYEGAIADYSQAIKLESGFPRLYFARARAYVGIADYSMAIVDFTRGIQLGRGFASDYRDRGLAYLQNKDYDNAIADFNNAIELDLNIGTLNPRARNLGLTYLNRGSAFMLRNNDGDSERAIVDFRHVLEVSDDQELRSEAVKQLENLGATS